MIRRILYPRSNHRRLFFLLLALLPTQLGLHFWPAWAYILGRKIDYLSPTLFLTDIILVAMLAAWIIPIAIRRRHIRPIAVPLRTVMGVAGLVLFIGANIWIAASPFVALYKWGKVLELAAFGLYITRTRPKPDSIIGALSIGVLYSSWLAIAQFALQHSVGGAFWLLGERSFALDTPGIARFDFCPPIAAACTLLLRSYGTFPHPNVLGGFLATVLPIIGFALLSGAVGRKHGAQAAYYWLVLLSGYSSLIVTFSRSAWLISAISLTAMISVYVLHNLKLRPRNMSPIILPAVIISMFIAGLMVLGFIFQPSSADESVVRRVDLSSAAIAMWRRSPLIGIGLGNFLIELPADNVSRQINFLQPAHNIYLLLLSEAGLIGFFLFAGIVWLRAAAGQYLDYMYFASCCFLLLLGFVDHYPISLQQGQLWLVLLLAITPQSER